MNASFVYDLLPLAANIPLPKMSISLISSLPKNANAILDMDSFFVTQKIDSEGNLQIIARQFTPEEQRYLEDNPSIRNNPDLLLKSLSDNDAQKKLKCH